MNNLIYWSPFIGNVGTIKSCLNSAIAAKKFSKGKNNVKVINVHGEWNNYLKLFHKNGIEVINLYPNLVKYFPKSGYIKSRVLYVLIFIISLIPLLKLRNLTLFVNTLDFGCQSYPKYQIQKF